MFDFIPLRDGLWELRIDRAGHEHNVIDQQAVAELESAVEKIATSPEIRGVAITSAKKTFVPGGDIAEIVAVTTQDEARALVARNRHVLRRLETLGKPILAVINGAALGGGLELAMACTGRLASNARDVVLGLPEVGLGLMPGAGGTQRLPYLVGIEQALRMTLSGKPIPAAEALECGLVDAIAAPADLMETAIAMLAGGRVAKDQPWDRACWNGVVPDPQTEEGKGVLRPYLKQVTGRAARNEPAPAAIVAGMSKGLRVGMDEALGIEQDHFATLAPGAVAKNRIRTQFFAMNDAKNMVMRPKGHASYKMSKVGVLGAGLMGSGIAHSAARAGFDVALLDVSEEAARKGRDSIARSCQRDVEKGRLTREKADAILARIHPVTDYAALADADFVVEAVSERRDIKDLVNAKAAAVVRTGVPIASNTSTMPISGLAAAVPEPERFIGLHFFAPVERMPFVEVIRGDATSDQTLARALDFMAALRKTVVVVSDGLGFFTSRVVAAYTGEALTLLAEGVDPFAVDRAAIAAGMPLGPLAMADMTSLTLLKDIYRSITGDGKRQGLQGVRANEALARMVDEFGRSGRAGGAGIFDYPEGKPAAWPGLAECFPPRGETLSDETIEKRLIYAQSLETARLIEEGVVGSATDADVGSVLAWGFPAWTGGVASYVDMVGARKFVDECADLARSFGGRFEPPQILKDMAARDARFHAAAGRP